MKVHIRYDDMRGRCGEAEHHLSRGEDLLVERRRGAVEHGWSGGTMFRSLFCPCSLHRLRIGPYAHMPICYIQYETHPMPS